MRTALLAHTPLKRQVQLIELDRMSHELMDHHGQILAKVCFLNIQLSFFRRSLLKSIKFVVILGDSVDRIVAKLDGIDWDHFKVQFNIPLLMIQTNRKIMYRENVNISKILLKTSQRYTGTYFPLFHSIHLPIFSPEYCI